MSGRLIESVQVLRLKPDDVLVFESEDDLTQLQIAEIRKRAEEEFPGHRIIVTNRIRVRVTRNEETA